MNILVLNGSGRKSGNTARILEIFLSELKIRLGSTDIHIENLNLPQLDIKPCIGCRVCFDRGEEFCPQKDDIPSLRQKLRSAELVIAASPVYVNDVSGAMKNFIDRTAYACHRPEFSAKQVYLLSTTGGSPTGHTISSMQVAFLTWGFHLAGQSGYYGGALKEKEAIMKIYGKKIAAQANKLAKSALQSKHLHPSFFSMMFFRIQQKGWIKTGPGNIDFDYWQNKGWLKENTTFYFKHQANMFIVLAARITGNLLFSIFTK